MFVGSGTAVVQSAAYVSGTRPIMLTHKSQTSGDIEVQYGTSGDAFTFAIDNSDGDCVHWIDFFDGIGAPCGGKWGFSSVTWNRATEYDGTVPVSGQEVRQEFTGDGTTTSYDTVGTPPLAYRAGSLRVWVGGLDWTPSVTETDPDTGAWDLDYAPPDGATIKVWFVYP